ncbi:unnamed protein product [Triticum turgidum subsp. durum]|uniref:Uncharacterized protein n=1 Tax=Triticum turgidum subsp. durum TaxID=4567 RepID=A0A9R0VV77_TRITD|nr:unnamed protein product [Triticum turgidum subsp. durum]
MAELEARKMRYPTTGTEGLLMGILVEGEAQPRLSLHFCPNICLFAMLGVCIFSRKKNIIKNNGGVRTSKILEIPSQKDTRRTSDAAKLMRAKGITLLTVRDAAATILGKSEMFYFSPMHPPLTESAQRALDWAVNEKLKSEQVVLAYYFP